MRDFAEQMEAAPALVSEARGGEGFVGIAGTLLDARRASWDRQDDVSE